MPKKYSHEEFRKLVLDRKDWVKNVIDIYDPKIESITIICNNNHELKVNTKNILHKDKLKECPICKEKNSEKFCLVCGMKLKPGQIKFCSSAHSAIFNNTKRIRHKKENNFNKCKNCRKCIET